LPLEVFTERNFVADVIPLKLNFIPKKMKNRFLSHPLGRTAVEETVAQTFKYSHFLFHRRLFFVQNRLLYSTATMTLNI